MRFLRKRSSKKLNMDTLEDIGAIPIPKYSKSKGLASPVNNIEYILQRKATEHKKNGRMDLAIACLRKANEIFPHSNFMWAESDYLRLVEYLKQAGMFDEAREEERVIKELFPPTSPSGLSFYWEEYLKNAKSNQKIYQSDLVITGDPDVMCADCGKYARRILSTTGITKGYLPFPDFLKHDLPEHEFCFFSFYPYSEKLSKVNWLNFRGDPKIYSNRPLKDIRTPAQKKYFREKVTESLQEDIDRNNYDFLREHHGDVAPKSFGGFRRMKNLQSNNFLILYDICQKEGVDLNNKPDLSIYCF